MSTGTPLTGVRVLDLGWAWAGPFTSMVLADLGADVIKVESLGRIDVLRWSGAFADGLRHHERSGYHTACNRGKRSVTLDLKHPRGRELVLALAAVSDVVVENFTPRVLPGLGLGWDELAAVNPRLVMLSSSAHGPDGPERQYVAYGDHLLYASGMGSVAGHPDDPPTNVGTYYGDPVAGLYGALGVLAALDERDRTGVGRHLELAQVEGLLAMMPGAFVAHGTHAGSVRHADKSPTMAPHGFYRCAGDDAWVAIAVEDDEGWAALRTRLRADGVAVGEWPTLADRKADEAAVDLALSSWCRERSPWEVTTAGQALGVAAYPLMHAARLAWDHHLHERRFFPWVMHPVQGPSPIPGVVFRIGAGEAATEGARVRAPAPVMGQHNEEVFCGLLGLDRARYDQLVHDGVIH